MDRRHFLKYSGCAGCAFAANGFLWTKPQLAFSQEQIPVTKEVSKHEAMHYDKMEEQKIRCQLCPKQCRVADGERGYCGVRENHQGVYQTLVYGRPCTLHVDPIEKKPLFHYLPGSTAFSLATAGCNMECKFCQNWDISQFRPEQVQMLDLPPKTTAQLAKQSNSTSIAYTYSEPVIYYEYVYDTAQEAKNLGIGSVMISNGFIQEKALRQLLPRLSAIKIDFKGFTETFYKDICKGELKPVLRTLEIIKEMKTWLEIVILIVPTLNDGDQENKEMAKWIMDHLGPDVPVHITRFHPIYKLKNIDSTPVKTLERIHENMKQAGLHFAYIGNVPGHQTENTYCPKCEKVLIQRVGYQISLKDLKEGKCGHCGAAIPGVWKNPLG